MMRTFP